MTKNSLHTFIGRFIIFLFLYLPFEQFVLKFIPSSENLYIFLYMLSEIVIYIIFIIVVGGHVFFKGVWLKTKLDVLILFFLLVTFFSIIINNADFVSSIKNIRGLLRYVALYYLLIYVDLNEKFYSNLFKCAIFLLFVQFIISIMQFSIGENFMAFFYPRELDVEVFGQSLISKDLTNERENAVLGTLGQPGALSAFIIILACFMWSKLIMESQKSKSYTTYLFVFMTLVICYMTFKRLALILVILMPIIVLWHHDYRKFLKLFSISSIPIFILLIGFFYYITSIDVVNDYASRQGSFSFISLFAELFSADYWAHSLEVSRLWFFVEAFSAVFGSLKFFGFGPDEQLALQYFVESGHNRYQVLGYIAYKDVYWMALALYFGILGLATFWWIIWRVWKSGVMILYSNKLKDEYRFGVLVFTVYTFSFFWYSFAERLPILRPNAFFFWLGAALIMKLGQKAVL